MSRTISLAMLGFVVSTVNGCGYSFSRTEHFRTANSGGDTIRTVAVPIFESREFRRDLELQLTEAIAKRIETRTPYKIAKKRRADTILTGRVEEVLQGTIARDFETVRPRETAATLVISFQWKDLRTGEILVNRPRYVHTLDYIPPLGEDFYHAMQRATDGIAERIVDEMESDDW